MQSNLPPGPRNPLVNTYMWMVKPAEIDALVKYLVKVTHK